MKRIIAIILSALLLALSAIPAYGAEYATLEKALADYIYTQLRSVGEQRQSPDSVISISDGAAEIDNLIVQAQIDHNVAAGDLKYEVTEFSTDVINMTASDDLLYAAVRSSASLLYWQMDLPPLPQSCNHYFILQKIADDYEIIQHVFLSDTFEAYTGIDASSIIDEATGFSKRADISPSTITANSLEDLRGMREDDENTEW